MKSFVQFLFSKTYFKNDNLDIDNYISVALEKCIADVQYHFTNISSEEVIQRIKKNKNELPIFLYRLGNELYNKSGNAKIFDAIHWIMRECCSCEIYYSTQIDTGFYITHGIGTIIGSRNKIGSGFKVYHNYTVGHKKGYSEGCVIGSNVSLCANSQIIGEVTIGDNVTIGNNSLVLDDMPSNIICCGIPAKIKDVINANNETVYHK